MTDIAAPRPYELLADGADSVEVPAGTSLLVTAPGTTGREFVERELGRGVRDGDRTLLLTADDPAGAVADRLAVAAGVDASAVADSLQVVDCQTEQVNAGNEDAVVTQNVDTPRNLTDIGIGFKEALDEFEASGADRIRVGVLSLSVILSYVDRETVYRFCQTLTRAIEQDNAVGFFLLTTTAHDEETVNTLKRAFDGTVEVPDDDSAVRITGMDDVPADWQASGE